MSKAKGDLISIDHFFPTLIRHDLFGPESEERRFPEPSSSTKSELRHHATQTQGNFDGKKKVTGGSRKHERPKTLASDDKSYVPASGEHHQVAGDEHPNLTTNQGVALSDNQNSLKTNERGPTLLEDFILREKITHFDHERIPERIVHARATGVHGFFELSTSLKKYTTARILTEGGEK